MDAAFHQTSKISVGKLRALSERRNNPAFIRFIIVVLLCLLVGFWVVNAWSSSWWNLVLSQIGFGLMVCSVFAGLHETAHGTAFASRKLNRFAAFLFGVFHIYPSSIFREFHFTHHRFTHIPGKDPEISLGRKAAPSVVSNLPMYLGWLSGFPLLFVKMLMIFSCMLGMPEFMRNKLFPFVNTKKRVELFIEGWFVGLTYISVLLLAVFVNKGFWAILIGQIVGHCILAFYLTLEHNGLPYEGDVLEKTRSFNTNRIVKSIMWNMPYHAEHHAYPSVPFHALPKLSEELESELQHKDDGIVSFHLKTIARLTSLK